MGNNYSIQKLDQVEWSNLALNYLDYNYRQLWAFGKEAADKLGAISEFVAISDSSEVIGLANVRIKKLPFLNMGIAYITGGPIVRNKRHIQINIFMRCLEALQEEYTYKRNLLLRIITPLGEKEWLKKQRNVFKNTNFVLIDSFNVYRTIVIDLEYSEAELRRRLHQKWRNCLNNSEKNDIEILKGFDDVLFKKFDLLFNELRERKEFHVDLEPAFYAKVQQQLKESEKFVVHIAQFNDKPVAAHVGSYLGDTAVYLLGASSIDGNRLNASYLLQWHVMLFAKENGCRWYDLGGIDPQGNPGVYRFKQRMGGFELTAAGPYEAIPSRLNGLIMHFAESIYRNIYK